MVGGSHSPELYGHDMKLADLRQAIATAAFPDLQHTIEEMIAEGDKVMVRWTVLRTRASSWV